MILILYNYNSKTIRICQNAPPNGLGGSRATSLSVAHFALQNTKFGSEKGKVQKPARIPPQTPPAGGTEAEAGQFHSPRKIVCPAESKLVFRIFVKKSSNINQKTPPSFTFCEIVRDSLGAKRLGMVFFRNFEGIFEIARQRAVGNAEVRTNLFKKIPNPFGIFLLSVFFGLVGVF